MSTVASHCLPINTNCLEFFPTDPQFLACGMYQFDEVTRERLGGIKVIRFMDDAFSDHSMIDCCGVFEIKCVKNRPGLIAALSDGTCAYYDFKLQKLSHVHSMAVDKDRMLLNLDVFVESTNGYSIIFSDNCGGMNLVKLNDRGFEIDRKWLAFGDNAETSTIEVWSCCFDPRSSGQIILSGAENGQLKIFDQRSKLTEAQYVKNRCHDAGVTHVGFGVGNEHQILTGGYDDFLKIWDKRKMKNSIDELNLGGGVWRVRSENSRLLCSCMYNGWVLLEIDPFGKLKLIEKANYDNQLLYAVDWCPNSENRKIVSCTFYEKILRLSSIKNSA